MKIVVCILTLLYGLLSVVAPLSQLKDKSRRFPTFMMICGGALLIIAAILKLAALPIMGTAIAAITGVLAVCAAALINGMRSGHVHAVHHIIRAGVSIALIAGLLLI